MSKMIRVTRTDGKDAWFNPDSVSHVTTNVPPLVAGTAITFVNGLTLVVKEPADAVIALLGA